MNYSFGPGMPPLPNSNMSSMPYPSQPNPNINSYPRQTMPVPSPAPFGGGFQPPSYSTSMPSGYPPSSTTVYPPQPADPYNSNSKIISPQQQSHSGYSDQQVSSPYPIIIKNMGNPTVVQAQIFDPVADAQALRAAMKGFGTNEAALIDIICRRSNEQRQKIKRTYKTHFGRDLIEDIRSETSGNFRNVLVALLIPIVNFYAKELYDAMEGIGTDEDVLIEVLCPLSNPEILTIKKRYQGIYEKSLESDLKSDTSGNFRRLLVSLCAAGRDQSGVVNHDAAARDAAALFKAGEDRLGTDESVFNEVFCERNYAQLQLICEKYQQMTGHGMDVAIKGEFSGDIKNGLLAILQCASNKAEFFASRLHKSMAGIGTNDKQLIRLIVTRCEIDLNDIKVAFERLYGKSLASWIKGDTSGDYKHALLALCGE